MPPPRRRMHQTTVRFGRDLWEALEKEAAMAGVSVAQFIREAAVARLGYAAAPRGDQRPRRLQSVDQDERAG